MSEEARVLISHLRPGNYCAKIAPHTNTKVRNMCIYASKSIEIDPSTKTTGHNLIAHVITFRLRHWEPSYALTHATAAA
eukprot:scaffold11527_cov105-Skeletonema_dohrnii-CCMP3373.AAC.15